MSTVAVSVVVSFAVVSHLFSFTPTQTQALDVYETSLLHILV
jgi:hypothetical protein